MIEFTPYIGPAFDIYSRLKDRGFGSGAKSGFKRWFDTLVTGDTKIGIFGAGGTGKTTLAQLLIEGDPLNLSAEYDLSTALETKKLPGDLAAKFLVVPGQESYKDNEWKKAFKQLQSARSLLIINVVSFGLHGIPDKNPILQAQISDNYFSENKISEFNDYTSQRRDAEIRLLTFLLQNLRPIKKPIRMVTLIAKEDLWISNSQDVNDFYFAEYSKIINDFSKERTIENKSFLHHFSTASLIHSNFIVRKGENSAILAKTSQGYDLSLQFSSISRLFDTFENELNIAKGK